MKRALSLLTAFVMIFAAGCEKQGSETTAVPEKPKAFSADAEITYGELYMTAQMVCTAENEIRINILTPEIFSPLEIVCKNGECTAAYDGISFSVETDRFPQAELVKVAAQALAYANAGVELKKSEKDGIISYQGSTDRGVFILTQDAETSAWLDLSVEGAQLHVIFKNFKKL